MNYSEYRLPNNVFTIIHKKFLSKYPQYKGPINDDGSFADHLVQDFFEMFREGYRSHPSFGHGGLHLIAKETKTGLEISKTPRFHVSYHRAFIEKTRLQNEYNEVFHIFTSASIDDAVRNRIIEGYRNFGNKRN